MLGSDARAMTHSDPFAYFEEALHADCASLLPDAFSPASDDPDFVLLDDAEGRFVVDPRSGLICVASEEILERDRGSHFCVRLETREGFGARYVMTLQLEMSGLVPAMVKSEDEAILHVEDAPSDEHESLALAIAEAAQHLPWRDYAAFFAQDAVFPAPDCDALFGAACDFGLEESYELNDATLVLNEPLPAPALEEHWF